MPLTTLRISVLATALGLLLPACNRPRPVAGTGVGPAWQYQSPEHGFTVDFPTADWKQRTPSRQIAEFNCRTRIGTTMLLSVAEVKAGPRREFEKACALLRNMQVSDPARLISNDFEEGTTASGGTWFRRVSWEKGTGEFQAFHAVITAVWLPEKNLTVTTIFEGQCRALSKMFQSEENLEVTTAAQFIGTSVK